MAHKSSQKGNLKKSFDHMRANYKEKPKKSFYPFGHKKGALFVAGEAFREGWDAIFGKGGNHGKEAEKEGQEEGLLVEEAASARAAEPNDYDSDKKHKTNKGQR